MHEGGFDRRLARRDLPSHQWARKNAAKLAAVSQVTEAEQALCEALDQRRDRRWSKVESFREAAEYKVRTAVRHLAVTYLECGVAADEETAFRDAAKALSVIERISSGKVTSASR
jgi:nanoRNase/pAp phosphatase (c-di-AMP/oligoRNAs hydrolase)